MKWIIGLGLAILLAVGMMIGNDWGEELKAVISGKNPIVTEQAEQEPQTPDTAYRSDVKETRSVAVYRASSDGQSLEKEVYTVGKTNQTIAQAMGLLVADPSNHANWATIPKGTTVRSIHFAGGIARIDFSPELVKNFRGGSAAELMLVGSIVNTLTEIGGVEKVRITVNGKPIETIGGHCDVSEPIGRMPELLKK